MPKTTEFLDALQAEGYDFFTGVPCSLLKGVIRRFDEDASFGYVSAVREDSAMGMAAGAAMAGRKPAVFMQNSGLGVCLNAIVSLNVIYEIPTLIVVSWRGKDGQDAPEHLVMGEIMTAYFDGITLGDMKGLPWRVLSPDSVAADVAAITRAIETKRMPGALIVPKGVLDASS
ncbi:MAG: thiamine pyrophosphate-binding protein [Planctomycetota bacterium]|nr:thiamine pyrophosphate-binding protein [Planctomycetota bacterium]